MIWPTVISNFFKQNTVITYYDVALNSFNETLKPKTLQSAMTFSRFSPRLRPKPQTWKPWQIYKKTPRLDYIDLPATYFVLIALVIHWLSVCFPIKNMGCKVDIIHEWYTETYLFTHFHLVLWKSAESISRS